MRKLSLILTLALTCVIAYANSGPSVVESGLEKRTLALAAELRCLVCQNQTLADSHADLAIDLKNQIHAQLAQGKSDQDVIDYMVQRYGDFVLYRPPLKRTTWLLWVGPFLLLLGGLFFLIWKLNRPRTSSTLTDVEQQRAAQLLYADTDSETIT